MPVLPGAACRDRDPELFFGPHVCSDACDGDLGCYLAKAERGRYHRIKSAKAVCMTCPVRVECLEWALDTKQPYGVWGGKTERDRRELLKEREAHG